MSALDTLRQHVGEHAVGLVSQAKEIVVEQTREAASRRSGGLADGISATPAALNDTRVQSTITSAAPYSQYQDEGTGIYGPSGARIFPTNAKALRFDSPAAGGVVFAKSVAGAPGRHFFREPMPERWASALHEVSGAL